MLNVALLSREPDDVYVVLVGELATGIVPASIMGCTFLAVAGFISFSLGSPILIAVTTAGSAISILKVVVMALHRRALLGGAWDRLRASRWQRAHACLTISFAALVGFVTVSAFLVADPLLEMIATGMLFGYCSGIAARVSFRPVIAGSALTVAALPSSAAAAYQGTSAAIILAVVFAVFLLGGFETVRYLYRASVKQIVLRLDMATLARNDPLTGLLNRLGLRQAFRELQSRRRHTTMAVHCLDLDRFKPVNDRYGHAVGDTVLLMLAQRLRESVKESDIIARVGGDEFLVVQASVSTPEEAEVLARSLFRATTEPFEIDGQKIEIGVSIGYVRAEGEICELPVLMAEADAALYSVKRSGGGFASAQRKGGL